MLSARSSGFVLMVTTRGAKSYVVRYRRSAFPAAASAFVADWLPPTQASDGALESHQEFGFVLPDNMPPKRCCAGWRDSG
jgi:hypothetical protein